ncbi:hypothetical protein L6164_032741 [Bauhinia variegata]|uniref:Uncharacterized protein n=1 Tax=Bauhinia variegata TaxID=167791 RepID=A0ACB9KQ00_BAUVA|nr:hypothetical protein L6164_032741 [Bauhinia variegata]
MEFNLQDPLTSFIQQQPCTMSELFASESDHMPSLNGLTSFNNADFRSEAISLMLQVQFSCNLDPFVAYLASNYLDRFLSRQEIAQGKPWLLRLIVISCLSLASKMKNTPFSFSDIQNEGCIFEAQSIQRTELLILGTLEWRMRSITPFSFLDFFISSTELKDPSMEKVHKERASEIIFNAHYDIKFLKFKPSIIAAAALISASHELFPLQYSATRTSISACEYLDEETLFNCCSLMEELVRTEENESTLDTSFTSTETPVSVLERNMKKRSRMDGLCCINNLI